MQTPLYRKMSSAQRTRIGDQMSMDARSALAAIHAHPVNDAATSRWARFRMLVGDELFRRLAYGALVTDRSRIKETLDCRFVREHGYAWDRSEFFQRIGGVRLLRHATGETMVLGVERQV